MPQFTRTEAKEKLSCPHSANCNYHQPEYSDEAGSTEQCLLIVVECLNCHGRDHFRYDASEFDVSSQTTYDVGQTVTLTESLPIVRYQSGGETATITSITTDVSPHMDTTWIALRWDLDSGQVGTERVKLRRFEEMVEDGTIELR